MTAFDPVWIEGVGDNLKKRCLVEKGARMVVAVSGGLDSMVLLRVLHSMAGRNHWRLLVAHFNHQLRGRASDADEKLVAKVASELQLPMVCGRGDVAELQKKLGISLEMAARKLRHEFLAKAAVDFSSGFEGTLPGKRRGGHQKLKSSTKPSSDALRPTVALAHHADDQSELFFLRLFRGAGGEGIAGMRWRNDSPANPEVRLIRPLLNQPKSALMDYARHEEIPYREDATNKKTDILRNRIRHRLLPMLRGEFQTDLDGKISRLMETVGAEAEYAKCEARKWLALKKPAGFEKLPVALQRQIIRLQLRSSGFEPDFECVENLRINPNQSISIGRNLTASRSEEGRIIVSSPKILDFRSEQTRLDFSDPAGQTEIEGLKIGWEILSGVALRRLKRELQIGTGPNRGNVSEKSRKTNKALAGCEYFDADAIGNTATLRHWRAGDRFQPIGMAHSAKVQDLLTNLKVPAAERRSIVVAEAEDERLFWVQGLRISEPFKIRQQTERCLRWTWQSMDANSQEDI
jgi:tRNA(Ile)-lysidine synthase